MLRYSNLSLRLLTTAKPHSRVMPFAHPSTRRPHADWPAIKLALVLGLPLTVAAAAQQAPFT